MVATDRGALADARAAHDGLAREAAARVRRLETIAADRKKWVERAGNADSHIQSLRARREEAAKETARTRGTRPTRSNCAAAL